MASQGKSKTSANFESAEEQHGSADFEKSSCLPSFCHFYKKCATSFPIELRKILNSKVKADLCNCMKTRTIHHFD